MRAAGTTRWTGARPQRQPFVWSARQAAGLHSERISDYAIECLDEQGLGGREQDPVHALACSGGIEPNTERCYYAGQHRVAAQLDQGVRQTGVQSWEPFGPAIGLPIRQ